MSATPSPSPTLSPGELLDALKDINGWRRRKLFLRTLPPSSVRRLDAAMASLQAHLDRDPNGALLDGVMNRLRDAIDAGSFGGILADDITRLNRWIANIPTTRRVA